MTLNVLVVEDDRGLCESLTDFLRAKGCAVHSTGSAVDARALFTQVKLDLVMLDLGLPDGSGLDLLREFHAVDEGTIVVVITANLEVRTAVEAMKVGAYDYLTKPFGLDAIRHILQRVGELHRLKSEIRALQYQHTLLDGQRKLLGESPAMRELRDLVARAAAAEGVPVLILGESGTGKELIANEIHKRSARSNRPIITFNCSAIPPDLVESELFGHERGAFTDAKSNKIGLLEVANGGTVFLDEVGDLRPEVQPKLLRVVERQSFRRLGGTREIKPDMRIIAATNHNLTEAVRQGTFREDLYYRLKVLTVEVPPLRSRGSDVLLLAQEFVGQLSADLKRPSKKLSADAEDALLRYAWPGNVRELRNAIERSMILSDGDSIEPNHLPREIKETTGAPLSLEGAAADGDLPLKEVERRHILHVLQRVGWNKSDAARRLGLSRSTLKDNIERYGLASPDGSEIRGASLPE